MVAPKRGRGAKAQTAKAKTAEANVEEVQNTEATVENPGENNGNSEQPGQTEEATPETTTEPHAEGANQESNPKGDQKVEEKKEEPEPGKLLVENLPSNYLFDYQDKLKELFSKHGEVATVKRGPIIVTELTTTPTLSAIVEFKNKESMNKGLSEDGTVIDGNKIAVTIETSADVSVLIGVPHEASIEYVRLLFSECGEITAVQEYNKAKYKTLRVTFAERENVERALKLDRELRINGFFVTVTRYRDDEEHRGPQQHNNKNKRQHQPASRAPAAAPHSGAPGGQPAARPNNYRGRGGFNARANFRGARGRGFAARGGAFPRGGYAAAMNSYLPPAPYMGRPQGFMNDGQRPNKRLRQM